MTSPKVLTTGGIAVLAAVGFMGCSRQTEVAQPLLNPAPATTSTYYDERARSMDVPTYSTVRSPVRTITTPPGPVYVEQQDDRRVSSERSAAYSDRGTTYRESRTTSRRVKRDRPFSHSAAIVGGSAGAGAVIGALAGGGKGAGIGALAGGGAGLVYDRLTHKRKD